MKTDLQKPKNFINVWHFVRMHEPSVHVRAFKCKNSTDLINSVI